MHGIEGISKRLLRMEEAEAEQALNEPAGTYEPWAIDLIKGEISQRKEADLSTTQQNKGKFENEAEWQEPWDFKYQVKRTQRLFYLATAIVNTLGVILFYLLRNKKELAEISKYLIRVLGVSILIAIIFNPILKRSMKRFATWLICALIAIAFFLVGNVIISSLGTY